MARVLIVDDDRDTAEMLAAASVAFGHTAIKVHTGMQALEAIANQEPDIVLLDLMLPGMDGFETLQRLRSLPAGLHLPVIVVTAIQTEHLYERVAKAGGDACLRKPIDMQALADLLARYAQNE